MVNRTFQFDEHALRRFCEQNPIRKLAFFGSVVRDDFGPDSDIDVLVEFDENTRVGLMNLVRMELELSKLLGRKVDLNTPGCFGNRLREKVLREAEIHYVAA